MRRIECNGNTYWVEDRPCFFEWLENQPQPRYCKSWDLYVSTFIDIDATLTDVPNRRWLVYHDDEGIVANIPVDESLYLNRPEPIIFSKRVVESMGVRIR
jgi:hypothetical protein